MSISTATRRIMSNKFVKFKLLNASAAILLGSKLRHASIPG